MPQLATVDELIETLDLGGDNPARLKEGLLERVLDSAESTVAQLTGRQFYPEPALVDGVDDALPVTKMINVRRRGSRSLRVRIPDLRSSTEILMDDVPLVENFDYSIDMYEGGEPYTSLYLHQNVGWLTPYTVNYGFLVEITGRWGWLEVPGDIHEAVLQIAARRYHRRAAMFADQVDTGTGAFDFRGGIHPDVQATLRRYRPVQVALV